MLKVSFPKGPYILCDDCFDKLTSYSMLADLIKVHTEDINGMCMNCGMEVSCA